MQSHLFADDLQLLTSDKKGMRKAVANPQYTPASAIFDSKPQSVQYLKVFSVTGFTKVLLMTMPSSAMSFQALLEPWQRQASPKIFVWIPQALAVT